MRIAPIGFAFRNAGDAVLRQSVQLALLCTHMHPDAVDGAFVQAKAVAELAWASDPSGLDVAPFLAGLHSAAASAAMQEKLGTVIMARAHDWSDEQLLTSVCTPNEYGEQFQIHAAEAVACALWAFTCCPHDPEECMVRAVGLGGTRIR